MLILICLTLLNIDSTIIIYQLYARSKFTIFDKYEIDKKDTLGIVSRTGLFLIVPKRKY